MALPAVTAVVTTRDRRDVLRRTLRSVLAQRYVDFECVVVDDGSTDGTSEYLDGLGEAVHVVRHPVARGLPAARNAGLAVASTSWVAYCDDDDVWAPDKLASQAAACQGESASWCAVGSVNIDVHDRITGAHRPIGGDLSVQLRAGNVIPGGGSGVLASRRLLEDVGGFDTTLRASEDYDMWIRLAQRSRLAAVDRPLVGYRVWPGTMSTDTARQRRNHELVLRRHGQGGVPDAVLREADLLFEQYLARGQLRRRERLAGFRQYLAIAVHHRLPSHLVHAVGAGLVPTVLERRRAVQELREVPPRYVAEAAGWLAGVDALAGR